MCSIAGILNKTSAPVSDLNRKLDIMNDIQAHRGPDDSGTWTHSNKHVGLAHSRLSIIDLSHDAVQPMAALPGNVIVFNGEIYNHIELRKSLSQSWNFKTQSDTEVILAAYAKYGTDCLEHLKGMFAFAIWDGEKLFCARDRFGIKPFYYTTQKNNFIFASETKALLPFLPSVSTSRSAFVEYLTFQSPIGTQTLFEGISQLEPAQAMVVMPSGIKKWQYWDIDYQVENGHSPEYFSNKLVEIMDESILLHSRADVNIGSNVSGGIDSSLMGMLATKEKGRNIPFFHGRFLEGKGYDESGYAQTVADMCDTTLHIKDLNSDQFSDKFKEIIYHLDFPVAGPGVFPQYMVSELASQHVKVILGGQGGDEIFGGYARYMIGYFDQIVSAGINGTYTKDQFSISAESIISNMEVLHAYKPMMQSFCRQGMFAPLEERYFSLVNRASDLDGEVILTEKEKEAVYNQFLIKFDSSKFKKPDSYLDAMMHFDLKCLLPGLLQVEDRVSMAHGLESRVPLLHHPLIEFMATVPANIKFNNGNLKHMLKSSFSNTLPSEILRRKDKMGFPVPLNEWANGRLRDFIFDTLQSGSARQDGFVDYKKVIQNIEKNGKFSRKLWGFLCFEMWHQTFHDRASYFRGLIQKSEEPEKYAEIA